MVLTALKAKLRSWLRARAATPATPALLECEYTSVLEPVKNEIIATFTKFLFRPPTLEEIARHVEQFCSRLKTPEQRQQVVRDDRIRSNLGIRPLSIEIDITNQCNLRCIMCHFADERVHRRRRQYLTVAEFTRIAEQMFPLCNMLNLSFGTEPLLHHQFCDLLSITSRYGVPNVYMVTNGLLLTESLVEQILRADCLDSISLSIDGASPETYERIRAGGCFAKLIGNIQMINRLKERLGTTRPALEFIIVLMRSNIIELPALMHLAHDLGIRAITAIHMVPFEFATGNTLAESLFQSKALCNRMLDEARALAVQFGIEADLPDNFTEVPDQSLVRKNNASVFKLAVLEDGRSCSGCHFPWYWVGIDPYGNVNPCGWWHGEQPMGNVRTQTFEEIWNGEPYRKLRAEHMSGGLRSTCEVCPAGGLGNLDNKNSFLARKPIGPAFMGEP